MPYKWVYPDVAARLGYQKVFYCYKDDQYDRPYEYHYTTSSVSCDGLDSWSFDIRDFDIPPEYDYTESKLRYLMEESLIKFP